MKTIFVKEADLGSLVDALAATKLPAISDYELGKAAFLKLPELAEQGSTGLRAIIDHLKTLRILSPLSLGGANGYLLFGHAAALPQQIACALDPFAYVSHLSAMEYYGLTDRFPRVLYLTTPSPTEWRKQAEERMRRELGGRYEMYRSSRLPKLVRPKFQKMDHTAVVLQERSQLGAFKHVPDGALRVATIGRVFLDMLREPHLCGGMSHVIDIFVSDARKYLRLIVDEYERHGKAIDKVRLGYLLTEVCKIEDPVVEGWSKFAQRGGSRKLDPEAEYSPDFSERWKLSINVPSLIRSDTDE